MKIFVIFRHILFATIAAAMIVAAASLPGSAETPLLMPGKHTLYQRILTRPGAAVRKEPKPDAASVVTPTPFEPFYVYAEKDADGHPWLEVGRGRSAADGWMPKDKAIPWQQTIVAAFSNPAGRQRSLVFKTRQAMDDVLNSEDVVARMKQLRQEAESGQVPANSPVVSIEPKNYVDIDSNFYILPILAFQRARVQNTQRVKYLEIASLPLNPRRQAPSGGGQAARLANYKVGVVFVIDTTSSMQNYIEQTHQAVDSIRKKIANSPEGQRVRFGLIGFRDSIRLRPKLKYVTKTFLKLDENSTASQFVDEIKSMTATRNSSSGFDEDSIAGVMSAIRDMNWAPFGGRYIILVTDAGPRAPGPDTQNGSLAVPELNKLAHEKNIAIVTFHLKTEQGSFDHEYAQQQYQKLSEFDGQSLYHGIDAGNPQKFRQKLDELGSSLAQQISDTIQGHLSAAPQADDNSVASDVARVGRAMQLAYLGRVEGTQAPDIFEGWICDRDPIDRHARPVDVRVLMTKNQLSTLRDVIRQTIDIGNSTVAQGDSQDFFRQLQEAVARMARDPQRLVQTGFTTLGGALGEYLQGLPYQSEITGLTQADWESLSPSRERLLVDSLQSKIVALDKIHNDSRRWVAPYPGAPDGEYVTTVPLSVMP
jgi:hypothetical protein